MKKMNNKRKCFACKKPATLKLDDIASIVYACDLHAHELMNRVPRDKIICMSKM